MTETRSEIAPLGNRFNDTWTKFWFAPGGMRFVSRLRIGVGIFACLWMLSLLGDAVTWFGTEGLLPQETVHGAYQSSGTSQDSWRYSVLHPLPSDTAIRITHFLGLAIAVFLAAGLVTRFTSIAMFVIIVSYVHRAPMLFGPLENVLSFLVGYLMIAPSGIHYSLDAKLRHTDKPSDSAKIRANLSIRLIQVHLSLVYLYAFLCKLNGDVWWQGESVWWLAVQPDTVLLDVTKVVGNELAMNGWTYFILIVEFSMALLVWYRPFRIYLVGLAVVMWLSLLPIAGEPLYCLLMMFASTVYLYPNDSRPTASG